MLNIVSASEHEDVAFLGNKNIGHNHLALEIIRGRIKTISFPDSRNDSVTQVFLPAFAVKLLKWFRW